MPPCGNECPQRQPRRPVCIIDDDEPVAQSLKALLEICGFDVHSYTSAYEFLADGRRRDAGCLVIDQHMPGMSGLEVISVLKNEGIQLPTILISGRLDTRIRVHAAKLGVTNLVEKPFAAEPLIELVRTALTDCH